MISKKGELVKSKCSICGIAKESKDFFPSNKYQCKECRRILMLKWKRDNPCKVIEHRKTWTRKNPHKKRGWDRKHPEIYRAAHLVWMAIKKGEIIRPEICEKCKEKRKIIAHHENYDLPFEIDWLCDSCHRILHYEKRERENEQTFLFEKVKWYISRLLKRGRG